ncbi:leukocyte elastase inhibitor-like [Paramacrobiotus metropolitanus]|uniref:leukocyte elastase inhibitor-like n=1 Tax=Paramacrobiotus metropolitanus TaxID=2943436 RepID=UPI002445837D|nr:leukocyte elastase inhibitor-like [Paramacrobiotus metropolitanus]
MATLGSVVNMDSIDLYSAAAALHGDGSLMVSPLSILYCSMLLYLGAEERTKTNLESSFHFDTAFYSDRSAALSMFSNGLAFFQNATTNTQDNFLLTSLVNEIFVADRALNAMNVPVPVTLKSEYQQSINALHSLAQTKNFLDQPDQSRQEINAEVARNTANTTQNLLPENSVTNITVIVLVNTLYFKGSWLNKFNERATSKAPFTLLNGSTVQVDMMHQTTSFNYTEDDQLDIQCVELPFHSFNASMLILLPRQSNGLRKLEKALTQQSLQSLGQKATERRVDLSLPKFKFTANYDLVKILQAVGVSDVFNRTLADLSGMVNGISIINGVSTGSFPRIYVSAGFHQTFISVDEKGTEASAASALVLTSTSSGFNGTPPPPVVFKADHPFLYIIRNNPSKSVMFMGRVESF